MVIARREVLIPLVVLFSAAVPLAGGLVGMGLVLVMIAGAAGGILLINKPQLCLIGIIAGSFLIRFEIGTGTQTGINAALLMVILSAGLWVMDMVIQKREIRVLPSPALLPLGLFIATVMISFGLGQMRIFPVNGAPIRAQLGGLAIFVLSAVSYLVAANRLNSQAWLERFTWAYLAIGAAYFLIYFMSNVVSYRLQVLAWNFLPAAGGGSLFWVWMTAMALGQVFFNPSLKPLARGLLVVLVMLLFRYCFFFARDWASGWLPMIITVGVLAALRIPRRWVPFIVIGGTLISLIALPLLYQYVLADNEYSYMTRVEAWRVLLEMVKVSPMVGFGPANYYWYTPLFPILGYYVQFNSHNNYIDLLGQAGLTGLVMFAWFAAAVLRHGWDLKMKAPQGFYQGYINGVLAGMAGSLSAAMLGDWLLPFVYNIGLSGFRVSVYAWIFAGGLVAVDHLISSPSVTNVEGEPAQ